MLNDFEFERHPMVRLWVVVGVVIGGLAEGACGPSALRQSADLLDARRPLALASALRRAGLSSAARQRLLRLLADGSTRAAPEAARLLLADDLPALPGAAMERLVVRAEGKGWEGLSPSRRVGVTLRVARHLLRGGHRGRAQKLLEGLPLDARSGHLRALVALAGGDKVGAREVLRRTLALEASPGLRALLQLNAARLALDAGDLPRARALYRDGEVQRRQPLARVELAWLELRARRPLEVLQVLRGLPEDRLGPPPAAPLLVALALYDLCHPDARGIAHAARKVLSATIKKGANFLRRRADGRLYYVEATAALAAGAASAPTEDRGDGGLPPALQRALRDDSSFRLVSRVVEQLQRERRILASAAARPLRRRLAPPLERRLVAAQTLAGATVRRLLQRSIAELRELRSRLDELLVELDRRAERGAPSKAGSGAARRGRQRWRETKELRLRTMPQIRSAWRSRCGAASRPRSP